MINNLISIIIPVYNVADYLRKCLDSVVHQSYSHLEIILINDGSIDDSLKICEEYQVLDSRIKVVNQNNSGVSVARNEGLKEATGDYLLFVDGDDWLNLYAIEFICNFMQEVDLVSFSYSKEYQATHQVRKLGLNGQYSSSFLQRRITGLVKDELSDPSQMETLVTVWGKLYKTAIIKDNNILFEDLKKIGTWEDGLFNWEYLNTCNQVYIVDEPLYHYRKINSSSITSSYKEKYLEQKKHLFTILNSLIKTNAKDSLFEEAFNNRICLSTLGIGLNESLNTASFWIKYKNIKAMLYSNTHRNALRKFDLSFFPTHWKFFFFFAKYKMPFFLLIMSMAIKKIINK